MSLLSKFFGSNNSMGPRDPSLGSMLKGNDPWDLNFPLFAWSPYDDFTLRNAVESVAIFGELGAAKTTGSAAWILLKYLEIGMGGLVCCVKPGDRELIEAYAKRTGRGDSLIVVSPGNKWRCNLIRYALKRPGGMGSRVEQIVSLLMTIVEAAERGERAGVGQGDKFWQRSLRQILRNGLEVCIAAKGEVTMAMLHEVITTAPRSFSLICILTCGVLYLGMRLELEQMAAVHQLPVPDSFWDKASDLSCSLILTVSGSLVTKLVLFLVYFVVPIALMILKKSWRKAILCTLWVILPIVAARLCPYRSCEFAGLLPLLVIPLTIAAWSSLCKTTWERRLVSANLISLGLIIASAPIIVAFFTNGPFCKVCCATE